MRGKRKHITTTPSFTSLNHTLQHYHTTLQAIKFFFTSLHYLSQYLTTQHPTSPNPIIHQHTTLQTHHTPTPQALVHPPGEFPLVEEWGFSVAPGTHTLVGISSTQHHNLPPPYGICSLDGVPRSQCLASAKTSALEAKCNCSNADENEDGRTIDAGVGNGDERKNGMGENGEISDEVVGSKRVCNVSEAFMCAQLEDFGRFIW